MPRLRIREDWVVPQSCSSSCLAEGDPEFTGDGAKGHLLAMCTEHLQENCPPTPHFHGGSCGSYTPWLCLCLSCPAPTTYLYLDDLPAIDLGSEVPKGLSLTLHCS